MSLKCPSDTQSEAGRAPCGPAWTRPDAAAALILCAAEVVSAVLAWLSPAPAAFPGMGGLLVSLLFFPVVIGTLVLLRATLSGAPLAAFFGPLPRPTARGVLRGMLLLAALVAVASEAAGLAQDLLARLGRPAPLQPAVLWLLSPDTPLAAKILLSLHAALLAPLCEEMLFRGILLSNALRAGWGPWGIAAVALLFAICHGSLLALFPLFLVGLVCGTLAASSGSILPGTLLHAAFNLANLALVFLQTPGAA